MKYILLLFILLPFAAFAQSEGDSTNYTYEGKRKKGMRHGQGVCYWEDGKRFIGRFKNDQLHGSGKMIYPNGDVYQGEWKNGAKHGLGTYSWKNGAVYEGGYAYGKRSGYGELKYLDGSKYKGDWRADLADGSGEYWAKDGSKFEGLWKEGKKQGAGVMLYADGAVLQGEWNADKYVPCNCNDSISIAQSYAQHEAVFIGRVISIANIEKGKDEVVLEISQFWKGRHGFGRRVILHTGYSSCDLVFFENESYLIFANSGSDSYYNATQCFSGIASQKGLIIKGLESLSCEMEPINIPFSLQDKDAVCGCDGNTYKNPSEALKAGVRYWKKGACKED